ncbi:MAG: serine hydrolase [Myxococcales bacterium]|nr:serine hydrolase [Myxococcales bacterium]MCB9671140.1 serine hydrolase [Alphaproteobacteria bacterium]MCB9691682.1 serine hydrolase [Alphaproteobacteria bacterium]
MLTLLLACSTPVEIVPQAAVVLTPGVPWNVPAREPIGAELAIADAEASGLDPEALAAFDAYAFSTREPDPERKFQRTNAIVILRHGRVVYERYARGTTPTTPLLTWSVSKSFGATVVGAAVHEGLVDVNQPACKTLPAMCSDGREHVRLTDLLQMSSGLDWQETYETSPVFSSVMAMLYTRGAPDMAAYVASKPLVASPGTRWVYSSGDSNVVSAALKAPLGDRYASYPFTAVAEPIGMSTLRYERDGSGTFVASSYVYASARDVARWGQLVLDDGVWNGRRLLAEGWVRYLTTLAPAFHTTPVDLEHHMANPGAQWYVNVGDPSRNLEKPWPMLPDDAFGASGHWGKAMWIIPSWDMVVVRLGDDRRYGCSWDVEPDCEPDPTLPLYAKHRLLGLLAAAVRPHEPPAPPVPEQEDAP